jgi:hypothetical protein
MAFIAVLLVCGIIYFTIRRHQKITDADGWLEALLDYID